MAKANESPKPRFEMVEVAPQIGTANRNAEGGVLYPTGRFPLNAQASDIWRGLVTGSGLPIDNHVSKFGVDKATMTIAVYPVAHTTPNAAPVRINARTKGTDTFTFYLGGVFEKHHDLRPVGKRAVNVVADTDEDGRPIMLISLASGLQMRTMPQDPPSNQQPKTEKPKRTRKTKKDQPQSPGTEAQAAAASKPADAQPAAQPAPNTTATA